MNPRRSAARRRMTLLAALLLAANGAFFAAFTWPRLTRARRAESRARETSVRKEALEKVWADTTARKQILAQNRRDIESLDRDYVKDRQVDLFATQREIEKLAKDSGLRPKKSSYALSKVRNTDLVRCEVTLPLDGTYLNLTGFLGRLETTKRFIVIDQMALAEDEEGARMSLKLSAIFKDGDPRGQP